MYKKLTYSFSFVLLLALVLTSAAEAELVGWWKLDEGSGTAAADSSGYGNDGTLEGSAAWDAGNFGNAVLFEGSSWIELPPAAWDPIEKHVTVAFWAFGGDAQPVNHFVFAAYSADDNAARQASAHIPWSNGNVYWDSGYDGAYDRLSTALPPEFHKGAWVHWAFTKDADSGEQKIYINGELFLEGANYTKPITGVNVFTIGCRGTSGRDQNYVGTVDDFRLYDTALTQEEIAVVLTGAGSSFPSALGPQPEDGALLEATWASLSWRPGSFAVSHDVYLGTNIDDVNNGAAETFIGNQAATTLIVGFAGFPVPDGLAPGTTYYWRIDEVNDANAASPWKGDIWSFSIPPKTGYNPIPADGAKFIDTSPTLTWTPGFDAKLHTVYFGESFDEVDSAVGGMPLGSASYSPGAIEPDKTYYWRVDEFDVLATHKGSIWSFTTAGEGGGVKGEYFTGMTPSGISALTRIDPQINFDFSGDEPIPVGPDNFSIRWTGEVEAVFTETYTFYTNSDDGVRLWIDGQPLINNWTNHGNTEDNGKIDLVAGNTYSVVMEYYEDGGGAVAQLRWESPSTPKDLIPQGALSQLVHAHSASPANGAEGVKLTSDLTWGAGDFAASHEVYVGADADAVANATKASPEYKGSKALGDESLDPGLLDFDATYYWRVDEVNATNSDSPWTGNVWSFWTGNFIVVEDFEAYNDINEGDPGSNRVYLTWIDGFGTTTNGAVAGNIDPPFMIEGRESAQAMPLGYDNVGKVSEATRTLDVTNWTDHGVTKLSLWFRGSGGNSADRLFVALGNAVVYHPDPAATQDGGWNNWIIDLADFAGANLANVTSMTLGIGTRGAPDANGGTGTVDFDDIRLIQ